MGTKFYTAKSSCSSVLSLLEKGKFLLILSILVSTFSQGFSQTTSLSFSQIPTTSPDLIAPGRGAEQWIGRTWDNGLGGGIMVPAGNANGLNAYYRFLWGTDIETAQGVYNWTKFDAQINAAIDNGKMFSFGLMPMCTACGVGAVSYPAYLHTLMQAEATNSKDWVNSDGNWVPNWNSTNYLGRYQALLNAVAAHIASGTHSGKNYKDVIYYVDIRGYGDFGEWHTYPWYGSEPAGRTATSATLKSLIDMNLAAFPNYPNVVLAGAYDGGDASLTPTDVTYYALTKTNAWGQIGWRRDNWGDPGTKVMLDQNGGSYNPGSGSVAFAPLIMSKYMYAPVVGEPDLDQTAITGTCGSMQCDLANEIKLYHATSFGDGNFPNTFDVPTQNNVIAASKASGYRLILSGGTMTTTLSSGGSFNISLNWQNIGIAPVYENWNVTYELRKSDGTVAWTGTSLFKPKFFLPQATFNQTSDNLTLSTVTPGTYSMYLIIRDPLGYKKPLPLAITGVNTDGSYLLRSNITVGTGTANQPPTSNAGANETVTLPTSTATLTGTGTDADGTISSYAWTKVSGPSGGTIATATSANTSLSGLVQGVYVYSLTVTDNGGATNVSTVQVTVNASSGPPPAFAVNAGPDQTLAAGVTTTSFSGTIPASSPAPSSDTLNLIVIQGESNAAGNANNSSANAAELAPRPGVQILNHETGKFESLQIGVNNEQDTYFDNTHHGLELALADEVDTGHLKNPTYLVKIGISGSYVEEWLPNNTTPYQLWNGWIGYVDAAVAQMKTLGKPFRIIFWQSLGLNDRYGQGTDPTTFMTKMATIRANFRTRYGGNFPFLSTNFNNPPAQTFDWSTLWTQMAAADPMFFSIPVTGATYVDAGVHYDYAGFKIIAHNMINVMNTLGEGPSSGTGTGVTYTSTWSKVSGPTGGTIASPSNANTNITGLAAGVYTYRLSVTSNTGTTVSDDVQVTVTASSAPSNLPPVANAGPDQNITLPTNTVTINGSASNDPDGSIASYLWTKIIGPAQFTIGNSASANTTVSGLAAGVYSFQLKVTDNLGASTLDTIKIIVNAAAVNQPPVARAGTDQDITLPANTVTIDGSSSNDPDGSIASYLWTKISGPAQFNIGNNISASTIVSNLTAGVYSFQLKVTDNQGAIALDTIKVIVNAAAVNKPPVANAGGDITITLPTNVTNLDGSASNDPDGSISSYAWSEVSGPSLATIASASSSSTGISTLQQGVYIFSLKVTDNNGATDLDSVKITVNPAANQPPVANAGSSKTITLPLNSTTLNGSLSSDPDGSIVSYSWIQLSGPSISNITNGNSAIATVNSLTAGSYIFQLTVTDNSGTTAKATVKITVNSSTPAPQPPVANAGADVNITLPTNSATIDGSGSSAPSGSIVSYTWSEKSGPSAVTLSNTAQSTLSNLQAGIYIIFLTVIDNNGATASDSVIITVNIAPNKAPVANAGSSINLTLPNNSINLDGSKSYDPDGSIVSYSWKEISGPNTPSQIGANTTVMILSYLIAGQYTYQLTVTDNEGATASAQVKIKVSPATNIPPIANAGSNLSITAPANSINLNGNGSYDPDGSIASYSWSVVSGPGSVSILNSTSAEPTAISLQVGIYVFELTVTDNNGATANDEVTVTVLPKPVLPNQAPIANAGSNMTITAPLNSVTLDGSSSFDPDGTIAGYIWNQVSGPSTANINAVNSVTTNVSQLIEGIYVFALTVTDNNGASATDQVTITVNPGVSKINLPPVADAGSNDTIVLPNNIYVLNGSQSMDPDGTIESYQWNQIGGPNTVNSSSMNSAQVTISDLQAGQYEFQLTVTDNAGAFTTSTMTLTVEQATGVQDKFIVFPNPAHDVIHGKLTSAITGTVKIYVYNTSGQLVLATEVEKSDAVIYDTISVAGLASGMYTVQINIANRKIMVTKFIKD